MKQNHKIKTIFRDAAVIILSVGIIIWLYSIARAGSLNPGSSPTTGTLKTITNVYDPLASVSYDSSGVSASSTGNALQITKCILNKMRGGSCP
ncbi:MAG: hypothetical protein AAB667_00255 [Patescibacteria group bacterium]